MDTTNVPPPTLVRIFPPIWALIFLCLGFALHYAAPSTRLFDVSSLPIGFMLIAVGPTITIWSAMLFRKAGTEIEPTSATNRVLLVSGPFRLSRNPMYIGLVILLVGIAFCVGSFPLFLAPLLTFVAVNRITVPFEEAKMARQFSAEYEDYKRRVRRWL